MTQNQRINYEGPLPGRARAHHLPLTNAAGDVEEPLPTTDAERE